MPSSSFFELAFNDSPIGNCLLSPNLDATILAVNNALLQATSRRREDLVGKSLFEVFPPDLTDTADTGVIALQHSLARVIETGKPDPLPVQRYPIPVTTRGALTRFEERYWDAINVPVFDPDGTLLYISHHTTDVTKQVVADAIKHQSDRRYSSLVDSIDQGFCVVEMLFDQDGHGCDYRFIEVNPMFEKQTGLQNALGKTALDLMPQLESHWFKTYEDVAKTGEPIRFENEAKALNRWYDVYAFRVDEPSTHRVAILFTDITAHRLAEQELALRLIDLETAKWRQSFQLALADRIRPLTNPEEITATASELLGTYLQAKRVTYGEVDESLESITLKRDWTNGSMMSMSGMHLTLNDFGRLIIDVIRAGIILAIEDVTTDENSAPYAESYLNLGVRAVLAIPLMKNGRLKAILSVHDSSVHHWTSDEIALAEDMVDRTWFALESTRAQCELKAERDQSQHILDSMAEGFTLLDRDWTIIEVNELGAHITGLPRLELIGRNHWEAVPYIVGTAVEALFKRVQAVGKTETCEFFRPYPTGTDEWLELRVYPLQEGRIDILFRDITERKQSEEKLKEADRRKDEFLAMLAHELRNPLAPISAAAELLQISNLDQGRIRKTSEIIGRQVSHMTNLVEDLLDVSRVTQGLVKLDNESLDIAHIVSQAVEQVTPIIRSRRHHLQLHLSPEMATVVGDQKRLVQVISNILNNAAKYTQNGGHILLKTEVHDSHVIIEVSDNGIGMTPDLAAQAFNLFAQAERTSDRAGGGLGLGLALVKSLLELHGGTVKCESEGVGKGSKFTVCLPRLIATASHDHQPAPDAPIQSARPLRIMVVDDNEDAASMLASLLEASDHQVLVEYNARKALELAAEKAPEVCILDIGLPDVDGNELARRLREHPTTAKSILIAVTGYGQQSDRQQTLAAGFDHHLVKPVDTKKLAAILADIGNA